MGHDLGIRVTIGNIFMLRSKDYMHNQMGFIHYLYLKVQSTLILKNNNSRCMSVFDHVYRDSVSLST